jgi:hypothetical protein
MVTSLGTSPGQDPSASGHHQRLESPAQAMQLYRVLALLVIVQFSLFSSPRPSRAARPDASYRAS